jgi:hypothetical protein
MSKLKRPSTLKEIKLEFRRYMDMLPHLDKDIDMLHIESFLWRNELITWSDDELMTEDINAIFVNAAVEVY